MAGLYTVVWVLLGFAVGKGDASLTSIHENTIVAQRGGSAKLICKGMTNYKRSVLLFNNTKVVEKSGKFKKMANGAYQIQNIQSSDTGIYKYKQSSPDLTYKNHCVMNLQINEETIVVKPGSTAIMKCKAPVPLLMWYEVRWKRKHSPSDEPSTTVANNGSISASAQASFSGRISVSWNSKTLVISNAKERDSGKYTCIVVLKGEVARTNYYINLVVRKMMTSTAMPTANESESTQSRSTPPASPKTGASNNKSCATRPASSFRFALLLQAGFCFFVLRIISLR